MTRILIRKLRSSCHRKEPGGACLRKSKKVELRSRRGPSRKPRITKTFRIRNSGSRFFAFHTSIRSGNRSLLCLHVFLHLHPAKLIATLCATNSLGNGWHHLLSLQRAHVHRRVVEFYYHPTKIDAFRDILYLEHDVPFGKLLRKHAPVGGPIDGDHTWLHMFRLVLTGSYKRPREFNWALA